MHSHGEFLRAATRDDALVYHMQHDYTQADLSDQDRAMLEFVVKLNDQPKTVTEADVQTLRDAGFDDEGVVDVVMVCSLYNFMNRLADGLGPIVNPAFVKSKERRDQRFGPEQAAAQPKAT